MNDGDTCLQDVSYENKLVGMPNSYAKLTKPNQI